MTFRRLVPLAALLVTGFAGSSFAASGKDKEPAPLPKPASSANKADITKKLPPFFGLFGSSELISKLGFRSRVGRFVEYKIDPKDKAAAPTQTLRIAEVGPEVPGARWIEVVAQGPNGDGQGLRILTRGEKDGNVERIVARVGGMPSMEFPLEAVGPDGGSGIAMASGQMLSSPKHVGKESITVPLGQFQADHWVLESAQKQKLELWTTSDEKVPFVGILKMTTDQGFAVASKVGTDATSIIQVPPRE